MKLAVLKLPRMEVTATAFRDYDFQQQNLSQK
jgi:hypothetical protein